MNTATRRPGGVEDSSTATGPAAVPLVTGTRQVTAVTRFAGAPGQEQRAAQAWTSEMTWLFARGTREPPAAVYDRGTGVYTVTGRVQTTCPLDEAVTCFTPGQPPGLDQVLDPARQEALRDTWSRRCTWFDGRAHDLADGSIREEAGHGR